MRRVISAVRAWRVGAGSVRHSGVDAALPPLPIANKSNCCVPLRRSCRSCRWRRMDLSPILVVRDPCCSRNRSISVMRAQRRRLPSHQAMPATPEARRYPPEETSQPASARKPPDPQIGSPTINPTRRRHGCSGPHRPPPSQSPHEYERCILPTDAKDKEPCAPRSYGRCLVVLYNTDRPHSAFGGRTTRQANEEKLAA